MVSRHERQLARGALGKRMRERADEVHAVARNVAFWHVDDTGEELVMREVGGELLITFHGMHGPLMAKWLGMLGRTSGMALARLIRDCSGSQEEVPGRAAALALLQEMGLERKPSPSRGR